MDVVIGVMQLQAKDTKDAAATRSWETAWDRFSLRAPEGTNPTDTLILDFLCQEL